MKNAFYKNKLRQIRRAYPNSLQAEVAAEALEYGDDIAAFFVDLLSYGCQSDMVSKLIYYTDTHAFYDKYYDEIEELRYDLENDFGQPLAPKGDLKNWFAWLSFEETARKIADDLGIE